MPQQAPTNFSDKLDSVSCNIYLVSNYRQQSYLELPLLLRLYHFAMRMIRAHGSSSKSNSK